jgi:vacuolar-type H+-ATPase subunit I/STV1
VVFYLFLISSFFYRSFNKKWLKEVEKKMLFGMILGIVTFVGLSIIIYGDVSSDAEEYHQAWLDSLRK